MRIISVSPVPGGLLNQEFLVTVEHAPGRLRRLFGAKHELVQYRGRACWWHVYETGELITASSHWPSRHYSAKEMLQNWYQRWEWKLANSQAGVTPDQAAAASARSS